MNEKQRNRHNSDHGRATQANGLRMQQNKM